MKLNEVAGAFEKKRVIMYNADQTKAVYHNISMRQMCKNIYLGEPNRDEWGNHHVAVFAWFEEKAIGIMLCQVNEAYDDADAIRCVQEAHMDSVGSFIEFSKARIEAGQWFKLPEVELLANLAPELVPQAVDSRRRWREAVEAKNAERKRKLQEEEAVYVTAQNEQAQAIINKAVETIKNGGKLENEEFSIYSTRYDYKIYCVVAYLMDAYGIKLPIRTRGWINNNLANVTIDEDGACNNCQYYKRGNSRGSKSVWAYLNEMIKAVRSQEPKSVPAIS